MIKVQNIFYMLAYAFKTLNKKDYTKLKTEKFDNALDLYTTILSIGINQLIKSGLSRDYVSEDEIRTSPKGKINLSDSIRKNTFIHKKLSCTQDEYTENILLNQILKSVSINLLKSSEVNKKHKIQLKKVLPYFGLVDEIDSNNITWNQISYYRNNLIYKMLINVCYLATQGLIQSEQKGYKSMNKYVDDQSLHKLFEKFVLKYYQKHHPQYKASAKKIRWNTDDGIIEYLPTMQTDILLEKHEIKLIIDTKLYKNMMQYNYGVQSQHSSNLYQIFTYVKNADTKDNGNVSGLLLYALADNDVTPDKSYQIDGNKIAVQTINLNTNFNTIAKSLDNIVYKYFTED